MINKYRMYIIYVDKHLNILCEIVTNLKIYKKLK
jgi:hypothetical protein